MKYKVQTPNKSPIFKEPPIPLWKKRPQLIRSYDHQIWWYRRNIRVLRSISWLCINNKDKKKAPSSPSQKKGSRAVVAQHLEADSCRWKQGSSLSGAITRGLPFFFFSYVHCYLLFFPFCPLALATYLLGSLLLGNCPGKWTTSFLGGAYLGCRHS